MTIPEDIARHRPDGKPRFVTLCVMTPEDVEPRYRVRCLDCGYWTTTDHQDTANTMAKAHVVAAQHRVAIEQHDG